MAGVGVGLENDELKRIQKSIIEQLSTDELINKFYNGNIKYGCGNLGEDEQWNITELLNFPNHLKQAEEQMQKGIASAVGSIHYEIFFNGSKISLKELLSFGWAEKYLGEECEWEDVINDYFNGENITPPTLKWKIDSSTGKAIEGEGTIEYGWLQKNYIGDEEELEPVSMDLSANTGATVGKYMRMQVTFRQGEVDLPEYTSVSISSILMLSDIDMMRPFICTQVGSNSYYDYQDKDLDIWDVCDGSKNKLFLEVAPFHKKGYKWSEVHDCKKLAKVVNDRLKVDDVFDDGGEATIFKLYMNGDVPEILDCFNDTVISQKDNQWFFKLVIDEILALNKNIGVCYFLRSCDFEGKYRARKDKNTGEYIITVW